MTSKQEALDFLESLKIENEKPSGREAASQNPITVPTAFKPMPRPGRPVVGGSTPTTATPITPTTTTPAGFRPAARPPSFNQTTPPKPSAGPPPITNNSQQRVKPTRVFQTFTPKTTAQDQDQGTRQENVIQSGQYQVPQQQQFQMQGQVPIPGQGQVPVPGQGQGQAQYPLQNQQYQQPVLNQQTIQKQQPVQNQQSVQQQNEWWGSLLTTAQKGLQGVKGLAAEGARVVKESGVEKGLMGLVAPPPTDIDPNLRPVKLWFCPSYDISISEPLIRICKQSISESWRTLFSTTSVNFVDDTNYTIAANLSEAITISETKLEKLQKLSNGDLTSPKPIDAYLTLQPFYTNLQSNLFGETRVIQFWCVLLAEMDIGLVHASGISQSIGERGDEFINEMAGKVCQTVISDLVDEFLKFSNQPLV